MTLRVDTVTGIATPVSTEGTVLTTGTPSGSPAGTTGVPVNLSQNPNAQGMVIRGMALVTLGAGATGASIRIRQGVGTGGTQLGTDFNVQGTAGNTIPIPFSIPDTSSFALQNPGYQVTVTVIQTGAPTAAGTVTRCTVELDVSIA